MAGGHCMRLPLRMVLIRQWTKGQAVDSENAAASFKMFAFGYKFLAGDRYASKSSVHILTNTGVRRQLDSFDLYQACFFHCLLPIVVPVPLSYCSALCETSQ